MSERRRRLAHVTLGLLTGGQEKLLLEFAHHGDRDRFEQIVVSLTDRGLLAEQLESLGVPVTALGTPGGLRPGLIVTLRRLFQRERIDVVHTHDDRPLIYGAAAGRWAGCRVIHTHHHGQLPGVSERQEFLVRWAGRLPHVFATVSRDSGNYYSGLGVPNVTPIWNGIDLDRFAFQGPAVGGPAVTVARLSPEKNIANLLRAAAIVRTNEPAFRLEIAGDGPCREDLIRQTHELGLGASVTFLGNVSDVPALLSRAAMFVLPSKSEGISLTLLEAMARGLPVVATRVGGNPEVVVDGETGLLVPSDDSSALASAILKVRSDTVAEALGRAGRRRVEDHFDVRGMVAKYERLYQGQMLDHALEPAIARQNG